jgi:hypothetical protein
MKKVPLTQGEFALVDDEDFEEVSKFKWRLLRLRGPGEDRMYAARSIKGGGTVLMHRWITGAEKGEVVDHVDRSTLNNTRGNLRRTTQALNCLNRAGWKKRTSSRFKGVFASSDGKWTTYFRGKYLGVFAAEEDAAAAYDEAAAAYSPEMSLTNMKMGLVA